MHPLDLPEPPTQASIAHARAQLVALHESSQALEQQILDARDALARIVEERQAAIRDMERELAVLDDSVALTKAYVSPIKRLPHELLRHIFLFNFDDCAWSAWVLAAVCSLWRKVALAMPTIWSKVRAYPFYTGLERSRRGVRHGRDCICRAGSLEAVAGRQGGGGPISFLSHKWHVPLRRCALYEIVNHPCSLLAMPPEIGRAHV